MKHVRMACSLRVVWSVVTGALLGTVPAAAQPDPPVSTTIQTYCSPCHNGSMQSPSGRRLATFDAGAIGKEPNVWARAFRQLQAGTMPPVGARRPDRATVDTVLRAIEKEFGSRSRPAVASSDEVAVRLASMLWDAAPDAELRQEAQSHRLRDPEAVERQARSDRTVER